MPAVDLEENEWGQVMAILSAAPWRDANPLLMKMGEQLRIHHQHKQQAAVGRGNGLEDAREVPRE
jgi:hypothetical protein